MVGREQQPSQDPVRFPYQTLRVASRLTSISVLYTGGTIAGGSIYGALDDTQYGQLQITGEQIIARNPYLLNHTQLAVSNWTTEDDGSTGTNDALVMNMTRFAHDALCSEDSDIDGAIYTHGTNSLEETGFLMDLLVNCGKPIVAVGAMRPWTHLSFDGDANFFDGVMLAANPESRNRGLMVAFNARIIPGFWITKLHSTNPNAFGATAGGDLGLFINSLPVFFNTYDPLSTVSVLQVTKLTLVALPNPSSSMSSLSKKSPAIHRTLLSQKSTFSMPPANSTASSCSMRKPTAPKALLSLVLAMVAFPAAMMRLKKPWKKACRLSLEREVLLDLAVPLERQRTLSRALYTLSRQGSCCNWPSRVGTT